MNKKILALSFAGLLTGPIAANATLIVSISTDTSTDLTGTFSIIGPTVQESYVVNNFGALFPQGYAYDFFVGHRGAVLGQDLVSFAPRAIGTPDSPYLALNYLSTAQTFAAYGGMYNNNQDPNPASLPTDVYFRYTNLADTGGAEGTFSGSFCFSASQDRCSSVVSVPEPSAIALLCLGLAGLGFTRRLKAA